MPAHFNDAKHWHDRAAELRDIAATMVEDGIKASMLKLASDYDRLAARATERMKAALPDLPSPRPKPT